MRKSLRIALIVATLLFGSPMLSGWSSAHDQAIAHAQVENRFFPQTSFRVDDDRFFDYLQKRGGVRTFGFPVSRSFTLLGSTVQFFQRRVMQVQPDGSVGLLNTLDPALLPATSINFAALPPFDPALVAVAPAAGSPDILGFIQANAPDFFSGMPVSFFSNFMATVGCPDAFPDQPCDPSLLPGFDIEMWGVPTSQPMVDPHNNNFVFLRFQRGIMHFDATIGGITEGVLMGDWFKKVITEQDVPADLAKHAAGSRFANQWNNNAPLGLNRPNDLPNTNMVDAFVPQQQVKGLRLGMQAHLFGQPIERNLDLITAAGFNWLKIQVPWSDFEPAPGQINFAPLDAIVAAASARGMSVIFSVVTSPGWARADHQIHAPPDNLNDFGRFLAALASRYRGRVQAYEIWNEQNFAREWATGPDPSAYVDLLRVAFNSLRGADPSALVVSGALTPTGVIDPTVAIDDVVFLTSLEEAQNGAFRTIADAVGTHIAGYNNAPGDWLDVHTVSTVGFKDHPSFYFRRIDQIAGIMASHGDGRQVFVTEYEWGATDPPVPSGYEWATQLTVDQVAAFYVQGIQNIMSTKPWVGMVIVWNLNWRTFADPHTSEQAIFGILNADFSPRPIYTALQNMPR